MASSGPLLFALPLILLISLAFLASAQTDESTFQITGDTLNQYETEGVSFYDEELAEGIEEEIIQGASTRRSLFWGKVMRYYISYGALSANRIPCLPRSGRSYYTHNCYRDSGPVHPYTRGCSAITRCRRSLPDFPGGKATGLGHFAVLLSLIILIPDPIN